MTKPTTHQRDLVKLPRALAPLIERPQWAVWRWTQKLDGKWQKPPYQTRDPRRHASSTDPSTWSDYSTALAAVRAGHADGITYVLTADDPFAAIDLDHCRDVDTHSIEIWAQLFLERGRDTYGEVTPSGDGVRIWGLANGAALNRKFTLEIDGKKVAAELFRRTTKALTITGYTLDPAIHELTNIDRTLDWAVIWGERRKAAAAPLPCSGNGFTSNGNGCGYSIDQIEQFVRAGASNGANRSDLFHTIIGHYTGCTWPIERIYEHLHQFPNGIGEKYISEGRLALEVSRSFRKWAQLPPLASNELAQWTSEWMTKATQPETAEELTTSSNDPELQDDPELHDESADLEDDPELREQAPQKPHVVEDPQRQPEPDNLDDDGLEDDDLDEELKEVGMPADVLCATVFEPPNYAVPGYIVEGLTLLAGKPKIGKSWMMLHVGIAVACGSFTLEDIHCVKGDVLYAALEDNKRRLQRRLRKLLNGRPAPERLRILSAGEMPRLSEGGAARRSRSWS
jgi:AAA domain